MRLDLAVQLADLTLQGANQVQQQADLIGVHLPEPPGERPRYSAR
jgi:hypothetical protein